MENKIKEKIATIQSEKSVVLDGLRVTQNLAVEVQQIARTAFATVQNTDSIDEKIENLVKGLQDSVNHVIEAHNWLQDQAVKFDMKIETLSELLSELPIVEPVHSEVVHLQAVDPVHEPSEEVPGESVEKKA